MGKEKKCNSGKKISSPGLRMLPAAALAIILYSCASMGTPSGGPVDEAPPRVVRMNPPDGSVNVSPERITIDFDELVTVRDAFSKVTVSPAGTAVPRVTSSGRRVNVNFIDTLLPNTTYTIDFGNAIEDNNEGNRLGNLRYSFSTGNTIDTLRISGMVLGAADLEPQQGVLVGVQPEGNDSLFITSPFLRMTRTDDRGRFVIRGLAEGAYRLYALRDANNDFRWDNPEEEMAFYPFAVRPSAEPVTVTDTVYNMATGLADSTRLRKAVRFLPDDLLLPMYKPSFRPQYIKSYQRIDSTRIDVVFNAPNLRMPEISLASGTYAGDWYFPEASKGNDTVSLWITSPEMIRRDSISLALKYICEKSPENFTTLSDTLLFVTKRLPAVGKGKKKEQRQERFLDISLPANLSGESPHASLSLAFSEPLAEIDSSRVRLEVMSDTVWKPVGREGWLRREAFSPRRVLVDYPWEYGSTYRLSVDSVAARGITGAANRPFMQTIKFRPEADFGLLDFRISGIPDSIPAFVELLNSSDKPVRRADVAGGRAVFRDLNPGEYYVRLTEDSNGDGIFTPGSYASERQPENVSYFPKKIRIRANWEREYSWDLNALAADRQKPEAIVSNKPERNRNERSQKAEEEEDDYFDPTANPFDPNRKKRRTTAGSY